MARSKTSKSKPLHWRTNVGHMLSTTRGAMTLGVIMTLVNDDGLWQLLAIETPTPKRTKGTLDATQKVLDTHSHKLLGEFTIGQAFQFAENYARAWQNGETYDPACGCGEIRPLAKLPKEKPPRTLRLTKKEIASAVRDATN